jgi:hypothetical protein
MSGNSRIHHAADNAEPVLSVAEGLIRPTKSPITINR